MAEIRILEQDEELRASFPIMKQLRTHLTEDEYMRLLAQQREHEHYRLVGLFDEGQIRALGGFRVATALTCGKYIYIDDLVSDEATRSKGYGSVLLNWIADYGKKERCSCLRLDSGVQRHAAHRFYLRERMDIVFYHFRKDLQV